jgi:spectinomycin phosphotransferase
MLEKPPVKDEQIIALLAQAYGLPASNVSFLPIGADANTAVYRVETSLGGTYFLKLRKDTFDPAAVLIPQFLHSQGIQQVIPALQNQNGQYWSSLPPFTCILYPYVVGSSGFENALTAAQLCEFGAALHKIHTVGLPVELQGLLPVEAYSSYWRKIVRDFQAQVETQSFTDEVSVQLAGLMRMYRQEIGQIINRAEQLASLLKAQILPLALCHADIHPGNLLLSPNGQWYMVDWDTLILAPKERDLMFIGAGVGGEIWNSQAEADRFYKGYGKGAVSLAALAYYRYERIVQDIAAFCTEILLSDQANADRAQGLRYFQGQFLPGDVIDMAHRSYQKLESAG